MKILLQTAVNTLEAEIAGEATERSGLQLSGAAVSLLHTVGSILTSMTGDALDLKPAGGQQFGGRTLPPACHPILSTSSFTSSCSASSVSSAASSISSSDAQLPFPQPSAVATATATPTLPLSLVLPQASAPPQSGIPVSSPPDPAFSGLVSEVWISAVAAAAASHGGLVFPSSSSFTHSDHTVTMTTGPQGPGNLEPVVSSVGPLAGHFFPPIPGFGQFSASNLLSFYEQALPSHCNTASVTNTAASATGSIPLQSLQPLGSGLLSTPQSAHCLTPAVSRHLSAYSASPGLFAGCRTPTPTATPTPMATPTTPTTNASNSAATTPATSHIGHTSYTSARLFARHSSPAGGLVGQASSVGRLSNEPMGVAARHPLAGSMGSGPSGKSRLSARNALPAAPADFSPGPASSAGLCARLGLESALVGAGVGVGGGVSGEGVIICPVCQFDARWFSELRAHMVNHSEHRMFGCCYCVYRAKWKWDVAKHMRRCPRARHVAHLQNELLLRIVKYHPPPVGDILHNYFPQDGFPGVDIDRPISPPTATLTPESTSGPPPVFTPSTPVQ
ncbi:unnamed protein product, partial [Protopolystoma xenopodis]